MKLRYGVDNPGEVGSTAVYLPSWIRINSVRKIANATLQCIRDLDKWLLKTGDPLSQVTFITGIYKKGHAVFPFTHHKLDMTDVAPLVNAIPHSPDDTILPTANRVLELQERKSDLETITGTATTIAQITSIQEKVVKPLC